MCGQMLAPSIWSVLSGGVLHAARTKIVTAMLHNVFAEGLSDPPCVPGWLAAEKV